MLVVARRGHERDVQEILEKWDLNAAVIGEVIAEPVYRVTEGDRVVAEFPGSRLVTECPVYTPEARESEDVRRLARAATWMGSRSCRRRAIRAGHWNASSARRPSPTRRGWCGSTTARCGRAPWWVPGRRTPPWCGCVGPRKAIAMKTDCNGRYVYLDPRMGGRIAVAEAARNVACAGARPMAITNCLNFGNPRRPEVFFQFREAVAGMGEACTALGTPVTGGNVSFYNESPGRAVYPTPTIGMVGLVDDLDHVTRAGFSTTGRRDRPARREQRRDSVASEYLRWIHDVVAGYPPRVRSAGRTAAHRRAAAPPSGAVTWRRRTIAAKAASRWHSPSAAS